MKSYQRDAGFSLVEVLVALAIGMIIVLAVSQVFVSNRTSYRQAEALARIQENGRFVLDALGSDIRMAGAIGCKKDSAPNTGGDGYPKNIALPISDNFLILDRGITGYKAGSGAPPAGLAWSEAKTGSSVIAIKYADSAVANVRTDLASVTSNIVIDGNPAAFTAGEVLVISDCQYADVFRSGSVSEPYMPPGTAVNITHTTTTNTTANFTVAYLKGAEVSRLVSRIYYVGNGTGGCRVDTLCRKNLTLVSGTPVMATEEFIPQIEAFDLSYGVDTDANADGSANKYVEALDVTNWSRVASVQVNVLAQSKDNDLIVKGPASYWYKGQTQTASAATDRHLRRGFTQIFTVRNAYVKE